MESSPESRKIWTPIRTKPRQEKKLAQFCRTYRVATYLPLIKKVHRYDKRKVTFSLPMLPGYVFCRIDAPGFELLRKSNCVVYKIDVDVYAEKRLREDMRALHAFERLSGLQTIEVNPEIVPGTVIEVVRGPLRGSRGIVKGRKSHTMLVVNIELLGQSVAAEINAADLEAE